MAATEQTIKQVKTLESGDYKYGFSSDIENIQAPKGLNEEIVKLKGDIKKFTTKSTIKLLKKKYE